MFPTIVFYLFLFVAIWFTVLTIVRVLYKQKLDIQLVVLSAAWTVVIAHLMRIW